MDFIDQLKTLASRIEKTKDLIQTEEATKNAFVLPLIQALGYDVFNPLEVVPEFTADFGTKKGEKVDYAIFRDGEPIMLFECKKCGSALDQGCASQLYRYFSIAKAKIGVLTNGIVYQFYTDLDEPNKMDQKPFMEFDLLDMREALIPELKKLTKSAFSLEQTLSTASELKYSREIRRIITDEIASPSEDFVRFFASRVYNGKVTQRVREQFEDIVKRALHQFIADKINERIKTALSSEGGGKGVDMKEVEEVQAPEPEDRVVTTEEELEGFYIVKSIVHDVVDPNRVAHRDTVGYLGILLDDNNRKPICRLHLNREKKYIGLFDENKVERRIPINGINDIYNHADDLKATVLRYDGITVTAPTSPLSPTLPTPPQQE